MVFFSLRFFVSITQEFCIDFVNFSLLWLVKLGIKSFRVPEIFIDIPETATVGSLKV